MPPEDPIAHLAFTWTHRCNWAGTAARPYVPFTTNPPKPRPSGPLPTDNPTAARREL